MKAAVLQGGPHDGLTLRAGGSDIFATEVCVTRNGVGPVTYVLTEQFDEHGEPIYTPKENETNE